MRRYFWICIVERRGIDTNCDEKKPVKASISDYIEANHKLITSLGAFVALTVLANSVDQNFLTNVLVVLFVGCAVLVWFELLRKFPENRTFSLGLFYGAVNAASSSLLLYWAYLQSVRAPSFLFILLFVTLVALLSWLWHMLSRRSKLWERIQSLEDKPRRRTEMAVSWIAYLLIVLLSAFVSSRTAGPANSWLKSLGATATITVPGQTMPQGDSLSVDASEEPADTATAAATSTVNTPTDPMVVDTGVRLTDSAR
jgi:hypothetical protein